jgi:serine/threonine protein kinase
LHDHSILHRDIKGGNVLISNDGIVKLADFGAAKRIQSLHAMQTLTMRGTPYFMAPEVFEEKYNSKADIWSVACVALQMATGMPPWKTFSNPTTLYLHLHNSEGLPPLEWPDNCTMEDKQEFVDMLQRCFWRNPDQRPTAHGLLSDPFLTHSSSEEEEPSSPCSELFSPVSTVTRSSTPPFQSPPLPRRIIKLNYTPQQQVVSPLHNHSPPVLDSREWPSWARQQVTKAKMVDDSLALSASPNPFARTLSSPLKGLQYVP